MNKRNFAVSTAIVAILAYAAFLFPVNRENNRGGILKDASSAIVEAAPKAAAAKPKASGVKPRDVITKSLSGGHAVVLYFYADQIKDSLDNFKKVQEAASKINAVTVKAEAYKEQDLSFDYGVEYVPSVFIIKPGVGVANAFIVDVDPASISNSKSGAKSEGMDNIRKGVKGKKPTLLFFMADWCGYCAKTIPEVDKYRKQYGSDVNIVDVDIERDTKMGELYLVSGVPVLVALDANGAIYRRMGYPSGYGEFEKVFAQLGIKKKKKAGAGA